MQRFSRKQAREVDRRASEDLGIPPLILMENAGAGAAAIAREMQENKGFQADCSPVVCVAGTGGNGGDALVVARHLAVTDFPVRILLFRSADSPNPGPETALHEFICRRMGVPEVRIETEEDVAACRASLREAGLIVDGLFGSGLSRPVTGLARSLVEAVNEAGRPVLALDLPSGLDCDTGEPLGACVRATVTATFCAPKLGFAAPGASAWTGVVRVVGIGAPLR
jgi:NAD(P)H-hydrate epimerase